MAPWVFARVSAGAASVIMAVPESRRGSSEAEQAQGKGEHGYGIVGGGRGDDAGGEQGQPDAAATGTRP